MKHTILSIVISAIVTLSCSSYTLASSFTTYYDGIQGYQWLNFEETLGKSRTEVEALLATSEFAGYQYASRAETATLIEWLAGGSIVFSTNADNEEATNINNISPPTDWLAHTTKYSNSDYDTLEYAFYYGDNLELPTDTTYYGRFSYYEFNFPKIDYGLSVYETMGASSLVSSASISSLLNNIKYNTIASLLVRQPSYNAVPEPASFSLLGLGLLVFTFYNRKK